MQEQSEFHPGRKQKTAPLLVIICSLAIVWIIVVITLGPKDRTNYGITMANYERLQTGMTYAQACEILGKPGTESSRGEIAGHVTVLYSWQGDGLANMNAMFQNDKLVTKAQYGLK